MKKTLIAIGMMFASVMPVQAQVGNPTSKLAWDQSAPTLSEANGYTYRYYPDGAATGTVLSGVTCAGTASPFVCQVGFPAFTPGNHSLTLSAANAAGESAQSAPINFTFVVIPAAPANLRIQ